jgi:hypothetical protein
VTASNWAVLKCKFADDNTATVPDLHYERLFTGVGSGSSNMVDFFSDVSHGQLDLSGSKVFGWFTLPIDKAAYVGNATAGAGQYDRNGLVNLCRQTATNSGVNLPAFNGTLVTLNGGVDLFGYVGGMTAFCDSNSLSPSPLGQEMGHGYGLDHARKDGSSADYQDPWDVMSVYASFMASNTEWGSIGPALNAWCMRSQSWLDETRVWTSSAFAFDDVTVELRPLHRHDLPGLLAAELGPYLIEYRPAERWDAAFPRSAVFVHRFEDNHSYVMAGTGANYDLAAGDVFEVGSQDFIYGAWDRVEVVSIDDNELVATLGLTHRSRSPLPFWELVALIVGGVAVDGGGGAIYGGKFHPIPPRGPEIEILQQLVAYLGAAEIGDVALRAQVRQAAFAAIARTAEKQSARLDPIRSPIRPQREIDESSG